MLAIQAIAILTGGLATVTGLIVTLDGTSGAGTCAQFPECLARSSGWVSLVHVGAAGILLLLSLLLVLLTYGVRTETRFRRAWWAALAALAELLVMASLGAALATGAVSDAFASGQLVLLAIFVVLNAAAAWFAHGKPALSLTTSSSETAEL
jgi:hypothetical protein